MKKKSIFGSLCICLFFIGYISAHPWNTAWDWCHYCRTNCDQRWVWWNVRHCHWWYSAASFKSSIPTCPANAYYSSSEWGCICSQWFVSSSDWYRCIEDPNVTCRKKYPWTYFSPENNSCICPGRDIRRWDSVTKSCPPEYKSCKESFWENSISIWDNKCSCDKWYIMWNTSCYKDPDYEENLKKQNDIDKYNVMVERYNLLREEMINTNNTDVIDEMVGLVEWMALLKTKIDGEEPSGTDSSNNEWWTGPIPYLLWWWLLYWLSRMRKR